MRGPLDVHRLLLGADVAHEIVQLPRSVTSADDLAEALGVANEECAVVHVLVADGQPVAVVVPAGRSWSPARVARAVGARAVRQADAAETSALTRYSAGLVAPVALPGDVQVLVDTAVARRELVFTAAGSTTRALRVRTRDLLAVSSARVGALAHRGATPAGVGSRDRWATTRFAVRTL